MKNWKKFAIVIGGTIILSLLFFGIILYFSPNMSCADECKERGTDFHRIVRNHDFKYNELCICYSEEVTTRFWLK